MYALYLTSAKYQQHPHESMLATQASFSSYCHTSYLVSKPCQVSGVEQRVCRSLLTVKRIRKGRQVGTEEQSPKLGRPKATPVFSTAFMSFCTQEGQAGGTAGTEPASLLSHKT